MTLRTRNDNILTISSHFSNPSTSSIRVRKRIFHDFFKVLVGIVEDLCGLGGIARMVEEYCGFIIWN